MGQDTTLKIEGMTCSHCQMSVEKALRAVPEVASAMVDLEKKVATITGSASRDALVKAVEEAGYTVV